ncbi:hypothetical protein N7490_002302 [Penicillium lividum]|nr:hypothetical protein N7490_002302 [Penicillium lividum]
MDMDLYRRLHPSSYPPRPSPLGTSQESREEPSRIYTSSATHDPRRPENDKPRSANRYYASPTPAQVYSGASRASHPLRESTSAQVSPVRNHQAQQHRRHASMEAKHHPHAHRRNLSQPQAGQFHEAVELPESRVLAFWVLGINANLPSPWALQGAMNNTSSQSVRRASQGSSGSPAHSGQQDPSAPAFDNRQMLPPSSPHSYASRSQSANAPTSSLLPRDAQNNQAHRLGSSMSISAMLGSDPERPARDSGSLFSRPASSLFGAVPTSATAGMSPPTAPARPSPVDFRRSQTPEQPFSNSQMGRPYRSGSGGGSSLLGRDQSKFGGLSRVTSSQYPEKSHSTQPSPQISPTDSPYEPRRMSFSGSIPRPSSQPPNAEPPARQPGYSPHSRPAGGMPDRFEPGPRTSAPYAGLDNQSRFNGLFGDRRSEDAAYRERERDRAAQMEAKGQLAASRLSSLYGEREPVDRALSSSAWEQGRSHPSSPESKRFPAPESASGFGFGAIQNYTKSLGSQPGGGRQPSSLHTGHGQPTPSPRDSPYVTKQPQPPPRLGTTPTTAAAGAGLLGLAAAGEEGRRKGSDELLQHRSLLAVGADGKRGGRASPLPQAVQGAQAPFIGPSGESSIKNELGRVFSGIGSGVGGVGGLTANSSGSGPSTPLIASPFKRDATGRSVNGDGHDDGRIPRPLSASGNRRSRKARDDGQMELESGGLSTRGSRRARQHAHQHHHHHHHHHHRHKAEEEAAALAGLHRPLSTGFFGRSSTPADPLAGHHHHHHHHHHHAPRPPTAAASPIREPRTTVTLEPILSSVAHLPRQHLGSTLYAPRVDSPSIKSSPESSKFGYTTTPRPLPRFEQRENCTFTVRVPRFRVDQSHREEICARRALWGTGVYTDDSDPVAAAIHSGFIRGAWGDDVDESMLDLEIKDTYQHAPPATETEASKSSTQGPRLPPIPPPNQDLHITLLILPRLDQYDSTVMFGLKSRKWDGRHDGMSFKVYRVDWVDDGVGRGEERGGEARRKRLRTLMQTGRICTGPALAKMDELRRSGVQVSRSLDSQDQPTPVQPVS